MKRILIIEDERPIAESIAYNLEKEGFEVAVSLNGQEGLDLFTASPFDLTILDIMLPSLSGMEVLKKIRSQSPSPVIMLTAKDQDLDKVVGLETGADDYVTKPFSMIELIARIKAILRRSSEAAGDDLTTGHGRIELDKKRHVIKVEGEKVDLPLMEYKLLELFMNKKGQALAREHIILSVWGGNFFGGSKTLDVHIRRLRNRIEKDPATPRHIITIRGVGYRFEDE